MTHSKDRAEIASLRKVALEDLHATSEEEITRELHEAGEDIHAIAAQLKEHMRDIAAAAMRRRTEVAKEQMRTLDSAVSKAARPSMNLIRERIKAAFLLQPNLAVAFRDGKRQSDEDMQSLYDDLIAVGAIKPNDER